MRAARLPTPDDHPEDVVLAITTTSNGRNYRAAYATEGTYRDLVLSSDGRDRRLVFRIPIGQLPWLRKALDRIDAHGRLIDPSDPLENAAPDEVRAAMVRAGVLTPAGGR